jgi:hypothetical protein
MEGIRVIPTRVHGILDYLGGLALILAPNIFGFTENDDATWVARIIGIALIVLALLTRYELGVLKVLPMSLHLWIDVLASIFLAASPFLLGFSDEDANVWVPHVVVGLLYLVISLMTETVPRGDREELASPRMPR